MSKKINLNQISNVAIKNLSKYSESDVKIKKIDAEFRKEKKAIMDSIENTKSYRKSLLDNGISLAVAIEKYPLDELENKLDALVKKHKDDIKPLKAMKKECYEYLNMSKQSLYASYVLAMNDKDTDSVGVVTINKGKKSEELVSVNVSFRNRVKAQLVSMGILSDNEYALTKYVESILTLIGAKKSKDIGKFVEEQNEYSFNDLYLSCVLELLVCHDGKNSVLDMKKDGKLSRHNYDTPIVVADVKVAPTSEDVAKAIESSKNVLKNNKAKKARG